MEKLQKLASFFNKTLIFLFHLCLICKFMTHQIEERNFESKQQPETPDE